jgi:hypothetical protein
MLLATQGKLLNSKGKVIFFFLNTLHYNGNQILHYMQNIPFSIVGNETSRGKSVLRDLGVNRSVDGTPGQLRHWARAGRQGDRFRAGGKNSICLHALCI